MVIKSIHIHADIEEEEIPLLLKRKRADHVLRAHRWNKRTTETDIGERRTIEQGVGSTMIAAWSTPLGRVTVISSGLQRRTARIWSHGSVSRLGSEEDLRKCAKNRRP
jgi:hypothetical protein